MTERQLTAFEHILLGLVCTSPSSGYDLKRIFAATPMGIYQPSSGSLYPALRRLEQRGLVQSQAAAGEADQSARRRHVYEPTPAGLAIHRTWLGTPVKPETVSRDLGLHLMRFVMMERLFPPEEVLAFLHSLTDALAVQTTQLEQYAAAAAAGLGDRHPQLALDHGLVVHRASLRWARHTIAALSAGAVPPAGDPGSRR
jgi:PadR family transcriptional regulator, regulatory protein AphA